MLGFLSLGSGVLICESQDVESLKVLSDLHFWDFNLQSTFLSPDLQLSFMLLMPGSPIGWRMAGLRELYYERWSCNGLRGAGGWKGPRLTAQDGMTWLSPIREVEERGRFPLPVFCFVQALRGWMIHPHIRRAAYSSPLIWMLISSRNTLSDTPRNTVYSGHPWTSQADTQNEPSHSLTRFALLTMISSQTQACHAHFSQ